MTNVVAKIFELFLIGVRDSFSGGLLLFKKSGSSTSRNSTTELLKKLLQCFGLNGIAFGLSIYLFNNAMLPAVRQLVTNFFGGPDMLWNWVYRAMSLVFGTLWVLPLLFLGKVLNYVWFQDIADLTYEIACGPKQNKYNFSYLAADMICSVALQFLFLFQSNLASLFPIPIVGEIIWLFHLSLLYSLYAFEYKWFFMGWPIHKRLALVDYNWPYFLGFGLPLALVTDFTMTSYLPSVCMFSVLFPLYVISGTLSTPPLGDFKYRPHIFAAVIFISNRTIQRLMSTVMKA